MKAARLTSPQTFDFVDVEQPEPEAGEVLVKLEALSVCGSDIHGTYHGMLPEEAYPLEPGRPCHECAGVIVESRAEGLKAGQRVIVLPKQGAGLQEYVTQTPDRVMVIPDWGPLDEWVMCQHSGTVLYSAKHWGNPAGKRIAVLGQGGIGLSFTMLAAKQGAEQVVGVDLLDYRLTRARELGATDSINPDKDNLFEAVEELTKGEGLDYVVDATGDPDGIETCINMVNKYGTVMVFSLTGGRPATFNQNTWIRKHVQLIPTQIATGPAPTKEIREMISMKERGWMDPGVLKSHNMKFDDVQRAYDMYANKEENVIKVVMTLD